MRYSNPHYTWAAVAASALLATTAVGCAKGDQAQSKGRPDAAIAVKVEAVKQQSFRRGVDVVGTLAAVDEATISSEAEGRVARLGADMGDRVTAGQALIELDREKAQYALDQQRAAFQRTLAQFGAPDTAHLPAVEQTPDVAKARAEMQQARQNFDRAEELHKRQLVPKQTLDDAQTAMQSKQASYDSALQNAKNLRANIDASEATMKLAERQLRDTSIRAPFDGYVSQRLVNLGQFVKNQTPVMTVVRIDPLKVIAEIPEKMAPWIKVDQDIELRVDAFPDKAIGGKLTRISPAVSTGTRAFPFEGRVSNAEGLLKPGTFARVHIDTNRVEEVLTVPYPSLQYRYGVNRAFVIEGDHLSARELKIGQRAGDHVEVTDGLKAGESVVVSDIEKLTDGQKVTIAAGKGE